MVHPLPVPRHEHCLRFWTEAIQASPASGQLLNQQDPIDSALDRPTAELAYRPVSAGLQVSPPAPQTLSNERWSSNMVRNPGIREPFFVWLSCPDPKISARTH
jgi:hypothetical protein